MEAPILPEGYFFRVDPGGVLDYFSEYNCSVQLRKKTWWGLSSEKLKGFTIPETVYTHPTQEQILQAMNELVAWWEKKQSEVLPYGDYPPKKLSELK